MRIFFENFLRSQKSPPFEFFLYFATECLSMNPKGSPLFIFRHYATFSKFFFKKKIFKKFSNFVPSRETVIFQSYRAWEAHFGCLESVFKAFHEYVLSIFRKLCASWALDIAPTLDVPVLFFFRLQSSHWSVHFLQFCAEHLRPSPPKANFTPKGPPFIFYFFKETYKTGRA